MNKDKNIITTIKENYDDLSRSFKITADYVLNNTREVALYNNMRSLAENSGVSQSTIVRFSQEIGLKGTKELQRELNKIEKINLPTTRHTAIEKLKNISKSSSYTKDQNRVAKCLLSNKNNIKNISTVEIVKAANVSRGVLYGLMRSHFNITNFEEFKDLMSRKNDKVINNSINYDLEEIGVSFSKPKNNNWNSEDVFNLFKKADNILIYDPFEEIENLLSFQLPKIGFSNQYENQYEKIKKQLDYFIKQSKEIKRKSEEVLSEIIDNDLAKYFMKEIKGYYNLLIIHVNHDKRNQKQFEEIDNLIKKAKTNGFKIVLMEAGKKRYEISSVEVEKKIVINDLTPEMTIYETQPMELQNFRNSFYYTVMINKLKRAKEMDE